jgi:pimeloyl-ACP methyl ester carboxylesterase
VIVLVHSGICDARMWDGFELPGAVRHELSGFGQTPMPAAGEFSNADELAAILTEPAALVGAFAESIDLAAVTAPTLVVVGELDKRDFHRIGERLATEIQDARHLVIEGAGHLPSLERPGETPRLIREFLQDQRI